MTFLTDWTHCDASFYEASRSSLDASSHLYKRVCPSVRLSIRPSVCPSVCPSIHPSAHLSVRPSIRPSISPPVCPSVHPSVRPSVRYACFKNIAIPLIEMMMAHRVAPAGFIFFFGHTDRSECRDTLFIFVKNFIYRTFSLRLAKN